MDELIFHRRTVEPTNTPAVIDRNRALLERAEGFVYKTVDGHDLGAYAFRPHGEAPEGGWPVMLYFYSSTWDSGLLSQFAPHALYFASRGMMGILIDYRVSVRHGAAPEAAMADARSAVRWARENAAELGINPEMLGGCGGGAGGHAILAAAMSDLPADDPADDAAVSCRPDFLVLFSPVTDTSRNSGCGYDRFLNRKAAARANLMRYVRRKMPPTLLIHSTGDRVVPYENSRRYRLKNWWRRNVCRLVSYEGLGHGFFNFNVSMQHYELTLVEMDAFLTQRGVLVSNPDDDGVPRLS